MVQMVAGSPFEETRNLFQRMFGWIGDYWWFIIVLIILGIAIVIIWMIYKKLEEERKERDDPIYERYKATQRDCVLNCNRKWIRKNYAWYNVFVLGLPLFHREHSAKILDIYNNNKGWYRGECTKSEGTLNILAYKHKWLLFFEQTFVIKIPLYCKFKVKIKDKEGLTIKDKKGKFKWKYELWDFRKYITRLPNGDLKLSMADLEEFGYYKRPVFVGEDERVIDMRTKFGEMLLEETYESMYGRVLGTGSQSVEKAMLFNPELKFRQMSPEKTKEEKDMDDGKG